MKDKLSKLTGLLSKDNLKIFLIAGVALVLLIAAIIGYRQIRERSLSQKANLYTAVSDKAVLIVETKNLLTLSRTLLRGNEFWQQTNDLEILSGLNTLIENTDKLFTQHNATQETAERQTLIIYNAADSIYDLTELLILKCTRKEARNAAEMIQAVIDPAKKTDKKHHNSVAITAYPDNTGMYQFFSAYVPGMLIASTDLKEVERAIDQATGNNNNIRSDSSFVAVKTTAGKNALANVFINTQRLFPVVSGNLTSDFLPLRNKLNSFSNWLGLDVSINNEELLVNGYSNIGKDYFSYIFQNQEPVNTEISQKLPLKTSFFTCYGISDFTMFKDRLIEQQTGQNADKVPYTRGERFISEHFGGEVVIAYANVKPTLKNSNFVMLSVKDSTLAAERLDIVAKKTSKFSPYNYDNIKIYELPADFKLTTAFGNFVALKGAEYVAVIGNHMLITTSTSLLTELMGQILSGYTLSIDNTFSTANEFYDKKSTTVLTYVNFGALIQHVDEILNDPLARKLNEKRDKLKIQSYGWQMENERGMVYHNAFLKFGEMPDTITLAKRQTNNLKWEFRFDRKPVFGPVVVRNNVTGEDEILVQDETFKLYFLTSGGSLIWSRQLEDKIMGDEMHQIDYYKNRKYQFLFNTAKQMFLLDRKGNMVEQFPLDLLFEASAPLSVFDYENDFDYRIFVPGKNKKIYLYKKDGMLPRDWMFEETANVLTLPVQYLSINNKDYLFVNDGERPYILSRQGKERIKIRSEFTTSKNNLFYLLKERNTSYIFTTDRNGYIKRISVDGTVRSFKVHDYISPNHQFMMTKVERKSSFIFVDNHNISIYDDKMKRIFVKNMEENDLYPVYYGSRMAVHSAAKNTVYVFNLNDLKKNPQTFQSKSVPCVGSMKPMKNYHIVTYEEDKLRCYELE